MHARLVATGTSTDITPQAVCANGSYPFIMGYCWIGFWPMYPGYCDYGLK